MDSRQICRGATNPSVGTAFVALAKSFGLRPAEAQDIFQRCLKATAHYEERVRESGAPKHVCDMLLGQIGGDVWRLTKAFEEARNFGASA